MGHGVGHGGHPGYRPWLRGDRAGLLPTHAGGMVVAVGCSVLPMWRSVGPAGQGLAYIRAPAVAGHAAVLDLPGQSAGVCTKEVRESHGDPGPLEGGGPGPWLLVQSVPP